MTEIHSHYGFRSQRIPATHARALRLSAKTISIKTMSPAPVRKLSAKMKYAAPVRKLSTKMKCPAHRPLRALAL